MDAYYACATLSVGSFANERGWRRLLAWNFLIAYWHQDGSQIVVWVRHASEDIDFHDRFSY